MKTLIALSVSAIIAVFSAQAFAISYGDTQRAHHMMKKHPMMNVKHPHSCKARALCKKNCHGNKTCRHACRVKYPC